MPPFLPCLGPSASIQTVSKPLISEKSITEKTAPHHGTCVEAQAPKPDRAVDLPMEPAMGHLVLKIPHKHPRVLLRHFLYHLQRVSLGV